METTLHTEWTVEDICKGFTYNELEGKSHRTNLFQPDCGRTI